MSENNRTISKVIYECLSGFHGATAERSTRQLIAMANTILNTVRRREVSTAVSPTALWEMVRDYASDRLPDDKPEPPQLCNADEALLRDALANGRGEDQKRIAETVCRIGATLLRKNADYGGSAWKSPVLAPAMNAGDAIRVRMSDKVNRLATLSTKSAEVSESVDDTLGDLAGYCILALARPVEAEEQSATVSGVEIKPVTNWQIRETSVPAWCEDTQYNRGAIVQSGGFLFRAKAASYGIEPLQGWTSELWEIVPSRRSDEVKAREELANQPPRACGNDGYLSDGVTMAREDFGESLEDLI